MCARVTIRNIGISVEITDTTRPLLAGIQDNFVDWMHACGGKGRCTTCRATVLNGRDNFSPDSPVEERYREKNLLGPNERLACQTFVFGDVEISVPDECKLPHIRYTDD